MWNDGAVKTQASVTGTGAQAAGVTDYILDAFGLVRSSVTAGGYTGSQSYIYDAADQGIVRSETYNAQSWADNWYRMGGVNIWHFSNRFGYNAQAGDTNGSGGRYTVRSSDSLAAATASTRAIRCKALRSSFMVTARFGTRSLRPTGYRPPLR